ncbi:MAG: hypothetical protein JWN38_2 [Candidatus Saccharibacteria bacterium]|nr:hypothetical protein [Candidatus Saccharibacteria bacterium]
MYQLDKDNHKSGLALLAFGRTLDLGDGKISDLQGTKSGKGEALDAGGDNLLAQIALRVARRKELIPRPALNLLAAGRVIVNGSSMVAKARGNEIHPSLGGKFGGFDFWAASCAYVVAKYTEGVVSKAAEAVGDVALGGYLVHGTIIAGYDYLNDAFPELRLHERGQDAHAALAVEYVDDGLVTGFDALD